MKKRVVKLIIEKRRRGKEMKENFRFKFVPRLLLVFLIGSVIIFADVVCLQAITISDYGNTSNIRPQHGEKRITTFLKSWKGNVLITTNGKYQINSFTKVLDLVGAKKGKLYKSQKIRVELIYVDGLLKSVVIKR